MNNEEVIDKAPTAAEVIAKEGGRITFNRGTHQLFNRSGASSFGVMWDGQETDDRLDLNALNALLAAAYSQFRAAEDAKWEEVTRFFDRVTQIEDACNDDRLPESDALDNVIEAAASLKFWYRHINSKEIV